MAGLIYYDTNSYKTSDEFFAALKAVPDFWDSVSENAVEKGDVTITYNATTLVLNLSTGIFTTALSMADVGIGALIAATDKGLVAAHRYSSSYQSIYKNFFAIGCDKNDAWGVAIGSYASDTLIGSISANNVTDKSYDYGNTTTARVNTQIIDLASTRGSFVFEDIRRVLYTVSGTLSYYGKLTMPNGEKYVKCGAFALRYTE